MSRLTLEQGLGYAAGDFNDLMTKHDQPYQIDIDVKIHNKIKGVLTAENENPVEHFVICSLLVNKVSIANVSMPLDYNVMVGPKGPTQDNHIAEVEDQAYIVLIRECLGTYILVKQRTIEQNIQVPTTKPDAKASVIFKKVKAANENQTNLTIVRDDSVPSESKPKT